MIAGVGSVLVIYVIVKPLLGTRAALLAALLLAVSPLHVAFSDDARGFALASFALLLSLWAAARLAHGGGGRWWWLYSLGAVAALYTELYAGVFLIVLIAVLVLVARRPRREIVLLGGLPALAFLPWLPELSRSLDLVGKTKVDPTAAAVSLSSVPNELEPLLFGQNVASGSLAARTMLLIVVLIATGVAVVLLNRRRGWMAGGSEPTAHLGLWLVGGTALGTLALQALVSILVRDIFAQRFLTVLIPLTLALLAAGVAALPWRAATFAVAAALALAGGGLFVKRYHSDPTPNVPAALALVRASPARNILTNTPVVVYYAHGLRAMLDRPFDLMPGLEAACLPHCPAPYAVVDDPSVGAGPSGGARPGPGRRIEVGGIVVRVVTAETGDQAAARRPPS